VKGGAWPFAKPNSAVAPRPKNQTVRLGSVSAGLAAKNYKNHQSAVEDIVASLSDAITTELKSYRPANVNANMTVSNVNSKLKFTAAERQQMKTKRIDIPLERLGSLNAFKSGVQAVKSLLKFYKEDPKVGLLQKLKNKLQNKEATSMADKLQREMGVEKETIATLLKKLEDNQMTVTEAAVLTKILTTVMRDLQPTVNAQAMVGGGVMEIAEQVAYAVFAVFASALAGVIASAFTTPIGGIAVFTMCMGYFYKKPDETVGYISPV
jgi:ERCC4-related helicase